MTAAVCLECGHMKTGAWTTCPGCRYLPQSLEDRARHLIITDHYLKPEKLEAVSREIQAGRKPQFLPEQVQAVMAEMERIESHPGVQQRRLILKLTPFVFFGGLVMLFAVVIWLLMRS
ncbi:hypothetical protein WJU23_15365 [Prosthecobacter sp. SYSU 5D2]|uniref:hypothetical protein n=1 Tax=Prosthecobacter sp. SYSU 5D2 TaxID=3134134 RepID=UPI0031FF20D2